MSHATPASSSPATGPACSGLRRALPALLLAALMAGQARLQAQMPTDAGELARVIDGALAPEPGPGAAPRGRVLLVPDAGDVGARAVAGRAFARLDTDIDRVVLIASRSTDPTAVAPGGQPPASSGVAPAAGDSRRTALGEVVVDTEATQACLGCPGVLSHAGEPEADQALTALLPFLQRRLPKAFRVVPLIVDAAADPALLVATLRPLLCDERTALVALVSSPFGPADLDAAFAPTEDVVAAAARPLSPPLAVLRSLAADMGWRATVAGHGQTSDGQACVSAVLVDDPNRVDLLLQASRVSWEDPATLAAFQDAGRAAGRTNFQGDLLSQPEQQVLLGLARATIHCKLKGDPLPAPPLYSDTLSKPLGCFVTLNLAGKLRGCVGSIVPKEPLAAAVQHYALAAAFDDKRFQPVTTAEFDHIEVEISAVTTPTQIEYRSAQELLDRLIPGVHGVLLTYEGGKRATFLPQVWSRFPEKASFLTALCGRGGIPPDAWKDPAKSTVELYESFDFKDKQR